MDFVRIKAVLAPETCSVGEIEGFAKSFKLIKTIPLADEFPSDAAFVIDARVMKSVGMKPVVQGDLLRSGESVLLASPELAQVLSAAIGEAESLSVEVFDAKKKKSKPYVIVRPLVTYEVISTPDEKLKFNSLSAEPKIMNIVSELEFDFTAVPASVSLFVASRLPAIYLARREFAEDLAARFSGILIRELDDPIS